MSSRVPNGQLDWIAVCGVAIKMSKIAIKEPKCSELNGSFFSTKRNKLVWKGFNVESATCITHVFTLCGDAGTIKVDLLQTKMLSHCLSVCCYFVTTLNKTAFNLVPVRTHATWRSADLAQSPLQSTPFVWLTYWATVATWRLEDVPVCHHILIRTK